MILKNFILSGAGESHGKGYTGIIQGLPSGLSIDIQEIQTELDRRKPGGLFSSPRQESDTIQILSGYLDGKTTGAPLSFFIPNHDHHSKDYEPLKDLLRPGHADAPRSLKYQHSDYLGGGHFSARYTLLYVVAGAFAKKILKKLGISFCAYVSQIGSIKDSTLYDNLDQSQIDNSPVKMANQNLCLEAQKFLGEVMEQKTSVGSKVTVHISGLEAGLGTPHVRKLNALLSFAYFSIPGVQAVSFGSADLASESYGHQFHDKVKDINSKKIFYDTNNSGGILGGLSTGATIISHITLKPPSSFSHEQDYFNSKTATHESTQLQGRFDPVLGPRCVPVAASLSSIYILDSLLSRLTEKELDKLTNL